MALSSLDSGFSGSRSIGGTFLASFGTVFLGFARRWRAYRELQSLDHVPFEVMKDVGFPGAERMNEK